MGRPKRVIFEKFKDYNLFHTEKTKMMSGVEQTTLYPIKETKEFFISPEVWAFCASKFRMKKKNVKLNVDIPIIRDKETIEFLENTRLRSASSQDNIEAISYLSKLFPNHEMIFFGELKQIITDYLHGHYTTRINPNTIKNRLTHFARGKANKNPEVKAMCERWAQYKGGNKKIKEQYLNEYIDFQREWLYKNVNMTNIFTEIGKNSVCYPVAFSDGTGMWGIEKYGKPMAYSNAGEIFFIVTEDKIYFEISRHF